MQRDSGNPLEDIAQRLRDLGEDDGDGHEGDRSGIAKDQAQYACLEAGKLGILIEGGLTFEEFIGRWLLSRAEHLVELAEKHGMVVKITMPPNFGFYLHVVTHRSINLSSARSVPDRQFIEFRPATPL